MRILALVFPRLAVQLLRRQDPALAGRPCATLQGRGDEALLSDVSVEATAAGVEPGMTPEQARQRCPGIEFAPDNAGACLDLLEQVAAVLRVRATPSVAIVSRNALAVALDGLDRQFAGEAAAASALLALARSWSGLEARAGVAGTSGEALCAARAARRFPVLRPDTGASEDLPTYAPVAVSRAFPAPLSSDEARTALLRLATAAGPVLAGYGQGYRLLRVDAPGRAAVVLRVANPLHTGAEAAAILRERLDAERLAGASALRLVFDAPGPSVAVEPWRPAVANVHQLAGPAVPLQRRLLRAS